MKKHNTIYLKITLLLFFLSLRHTFSQTPAFDSLVNENYRISGFNKTKSLEILDTLYQMAYNNPHNSLLIAHCLYEESIFNIRHRIVDTLLTFRIENVLSYQPQSIQEQALLQYALGTNLISEGKYSDAFLIFLQALEKFKQLQSNRFITRTLNSLGTICNDIYLFSLAEYYYFEAINYITPDFQEFYNAKNNIFRILSYKNKETAIDSMLYLIELAEKKNLKEILLYLYLNTGACFLDILPEKALFYFNKINDLDFDNISLTAIIYANMGYYYLCRKDYPEALQNYKNAQKVMEINKDFYNLSFLYFDISIIFEQQNMLDSALFYLKKHSDFTQKLRSNTAAVETHQKYITTLVENQEKDLIIAEQKIELKNKQIIIIVIILFLSILLLFSFYQHNRRKLQVQKLEKEKQEGILDAKIRELTSYSTLVSHKNQILKQIMELNLQEYNKGIKAQINEIIQNNINIDEEWKNFKLHFDKVHPHFFEKLKQLCSDLTEENLKICAYIKMGMTPKQIAQLLHVVTGSVNKTLYRLKKKLQLSEEESLKSYIISIKN